MRSAGAAAAGSLCKPLSTGQCKPEAVEGGGEGIHGRRRWYPCLQCLRFTVRWSVVPSFSVVVPLCPAPLPRLQRWGAADERTRL
jgi:hypothetical protein